MSMANEGTPLLPTRMHRALESDLEKRPPRRMHACCCWILRTVLLVPVVLFVGFQCLVWFHKKQAWREAYKIPPNQSFVIHTIDPLQGARPEFLFDSTGKQLSMEDSYLFKGASVPLAIVHGVEITAHDMDREAELLAHLMPGTYVQSIEYAPGSVTYFTTLDAQLEALCLRLRNHQVFRNATEMDIMGHSSGSVLARAVAQNVRSCLGRQNVRVRHYVGLAGPQQGVVATIPGSPGEALAKSSVLGPLLVCLGRTWWAQRYFVSTAAYLYDPRQTEDSVESNFGASSLLGRLNQGFLVPPQDSLRNLCSSIDDCTTTAPPSANSLTGPEGISGNLLLVASMQDEVVRPTESAFFSRAVGLYSDDDWNDVFGGSKPNHVLRDVCNTDLWRRDTIGLRSLWMDRRVFVYRSPTRHGPLLGSDYVRVIAPFLLGKIPPSVSTQNTSNVVLESICEDQQDQEKIVMQVLVY